MTSSNGLPPDEALLARLICSRLTRFTTGLLSVGLGLCLQGSERPANILNDRVEMLRHFVGVLRSLTADSSFEKFAEFRRTANTLREIIDRFEQPFDNLATWKRVPFSTVEEVAADLRQNCEEFRRLLHHIVDLLGLEGTLAPENQFGAQLIDQFLITARQSRGVDLEVSPDRSSVPTPE